MVQSSKRPPVSLYERRHNTLHLRWQSLRRNPNYKSDVQECLSNLQALYDQWVTEQQTLAPRPILSQNALELAREIDEIWHHGCSKLFSSIPPPLEQKHSLLYTLLLDQEADGLLQTLPAETRLTVAQELAAYFWWEQASEDLNGRIKAYKQLVAALTIASDTFCSWDPSLDCLPNQLPKIPNPDLSNLDHDQLARFTALCTELRQNPIILQCFPPLTMLKERWGILIPLDPNIPVLPFLAAGAVFGIQPHHLWVTRSFIEPRAIIEITLSPGATKEDIQLELNHHLSSVMAGLNSHPHYEKKVQDRVYYDMVF